MLFQEVMKLEAFEAAKMPVEDKTAGCQIKAVYVSDELLVPEKVEKGGLFIVSDTAFADKHTDKNAETDRVFESIDKNAEADRISESINKNAEADRISESINKNAEADRVSEGINKNAEADRISESIDKNAEADNISAKNINYLKKLIEKQAAGIIIRMKYIDMEIPEYLIDYAKSNNLPVMTIPYEIAVTQAIPQLYFALFEEKNKRNESDMLMKELLYGNEAQAIMQLADFNYRSDKQHIAIFFSFDKQGYDSEMIDELALVMPINLSLTLFSVVYPDIDGVVVVLELSQKEPVKDIVNRFLSSAQRDMGEKLRDNSISAGVSSVFYNPERMKECVDEAKKAMQLLRGYGICHSARYFEEIGIYRFFFELGNDVELEDFMMESLGELISYDEENNSDYVDTLSTYLDFGCNIGETAKYLYMHRNTIRYRITRVEEILGVDLNSVGVRFNLRFAFKIRKYLKKSE